MHESETVMRKNISMRLDEATISAARARAARQNRTLTNYIEAAVKKDLGEGTDASTQSPAGPTVGAIVRIIRNRRSDLERMGVRHLSIFGSMARGEERPDSDVDILLDVDPATVRSLFAYGEIQQSLEEWLGRPVDVADRRRLRPGLADQASRDEILAF
jgi:predicted nucleotidyltransferase